MHVDEAAMLTLTPGALDVGLLAVTSLEAEAALSFTTGL